MITNFLQFLQLGLFVKLFFMVLVLFYFVFCAVVYRQITLMTKVLVSKISPTIQAIAIAQILIVAVIFFLGLALV